LVADVSTNRGGITFKRRNSPYRTLDFSIRIDEIITLLPIDAAPQPTGLEIIKNYNLKSNNNILKKFIFAHSLTGRNTDLPNQVKVAEVKQFPPFDALCPLPVTTLQPILADMTTDGGDIFLPRNQPSPSKNLSSTFQELYCKF
jgi:hypothetical protein